MLHAAVSPEPIMVYRYTKKITLLRAITVDLDDVKRIFERLALHLEE